MQADAATTDDTAPVLDVRPDRMVAGGDALGRAADGRVVFVEGALPGERVRAAVVAQRRDFLRARATEVLEPSPVRATPPCPEHVAGCGGCPWQHVAPHAQAELKAEIVMDALRRLARLDAPPVTVRRLPDAGYRTTVRMGVLEGRAAFHRRHQRELHPVGGCLVVHPLVESLIRDGRFPGAREVLLRASVATGERLVWARPGAARPHVPTGVRVAERGGRAFLHETVAGRSWRVSARSFFQPGPAAADALAAEVVAAAAGTDGPVVDLYAGVGVLGAAVVAGTDRPLTAVESHRPAVADARVNLADLGATVVGEEVGRWRPARPAGVVIADPARPGLGVPGVTTVAACAAPVVVLVSCDPASFARDTALLAGERYRLTGLTVVDTFAHTAHVEVVSRFQRQKSSR